MFSFLILYINNTERERERERERKRERKREILPAKSNGFLSY